MVLHAFKNEMWAKQRSVRPPQLQKTDKYHIICELREGKPVARAEQCWLKQVSLERLFAMLWLDRERGFVLVPPVRASHLGNCGKKILFTTIGLNWKWVDNDRRFRKANRFSGGQMDRIDRWKLADELNVYQISLLIAGYDPAEFSDDNYSDWPQEVKQEIAPYLNALKNATRSKKIEFIEVLYDGYGEADIDWNNSRVNIDSFCEWMLSRNFADGYFIANSKADPLKDKESEFYAPKLAAAVQAWNEVTSTPDALIGKTPKKALEVWLRKHANEYGLTNKDGNPNEQGIEEVCKVANWKPNGGATPTSVASDAPIKPDRVELSSMGRKVRARPPTPSKKKGGFSRMTEVIDDDIPF